MHICRQRCRTLHDTERQKGVASTVLALIVGLPMMGRWSEMETTIGTMTGAVLQNERRSSIEVNTTMINEIRGVAADTETASGRFLQAAIGRGIGGMAARPDIAIDRKGVICTVNQRMPFKTLCLTQLWPFRCASAMPCTADVPKPPCAPRPARQLRLLPDPTTRGARHDNRPLQAQLATS